MYKKHIKRFFDASLSLAALIVLFPLLAICTMIGTVEMKGNPFFVQKRPGKNEEIFNLIKFRTMTNEKDKLGHLLPDDQRLTKYGKFLRNTSIDELPELICILLGKMSIIGPRPLLVEYLPYYTGVEKKRHSVRPGLTGLAQVSGRNYLEWDKRLAKDVEYVDNLSFNLDIKIFFLTIKQVLKHSDIAVDTNDVEGNLAEIRKSNMDGEQSCL